MREGGSEKKSLPPPLYPFKWNSPNLNPIQNRFSQSKCSGNLFPFQNSQCTFFFLEGKNYLQWQVKLISSYSDELVKGAAGNCLLCPAIAPIPFIFADRSYNCSIAHLKPEYFTRTENKSVFSNLT